MKRKFNCAQILAGSSASLIDIVATSLIHRSFESESKEEDEAIGLTMATDRTSGNEEDDGSVRSLPINGPSSPSMFQRFCDAFRALCSPFALLVHNSSSSESSDRGNGLSSVQLNDACPHPETSFMRNSDFDGENKSTDDGENKSTDSLSPDRDSFCCLCLGRDQWCGPGRNENRVLHSQGLSMNQET